MNNGRGDEHQGLYLGLNYYFCDENLKLISGIQHDELKSQGTTQFRGWTVGTSFGFGFKFIEFSYQKKTLLNARIKSLNSSLYMRFLLSHAR